MLWSPDLKPIKQLWRILHQHVRHASIGSSFYLVYGWIDVWMLESALHTYCTFKTYYGRMVCWICAMGQWSCPPTLPFFSFFLKFPLWQPPTALQWWLSGTAWVTRILVLWMLGCIMRLHIVLTVLIFGLLNQLNKVNVNIVLYSCSEQVDLMPVNSCNQLVIVQNRY